MPTSSAVGRIAAVLALVGASLVVLLLVLGGGSRYTSPRSSRTPASWSRATTSNVAGVPAGTIKEISLADDGQALVKMEISDGPTRRCPREPTRRSAPSRSRGSPTATSSSTSPPDAGDGQDRRRRHDRPQADTTSEVDLDQLFNTLDKPTVAHLRGDQGLRPLLRRRRAPRPTEGFYYLNPFLSTSRRVFGELNRDQANLERPVVDAAALTATLAEQPRDSSSWSANLNGMFGAIGAAAGLARLGGRPAARLHAPVQHHRGQPARRPRRRRSAGRLHPPGRPQAPALRQARCAASPATRSPPSRAWTASSAARARPTT